MENKRRAIAVDGPAGTGKSTLAKNIAVKIGFKYLDTGALYRAVGLHIKNLGISPYDAAGVAGVLPHIKVAISYDGDFQRVAVNGEDVTSGIRASDISSAASAVSKIPEVRELLLGIQRDVAAECDVVMDGRDIGTVILPDADLKIFLYADPMERARRRYEERRGADPTLTLESVFDEIVRRDKQDSERAVAPLKPAPDAIMVDNTKCAAPEDTLRMITKIIKEKMPDVVIR